MCSAKLNPYEGLKQIYSTEKLMAISVSANTKMAVRRSRYTLRKMKSSAL